LNPGTANLILAAGIILVAFQFLCWLAFGATLLRVLARVALWTEAAFCSAFELLIEAGQKWCRQIGRRYAEMKLAEASLPAPARPEGE
jgi:hypothetical protein